MSDEVDAFTYSSMRGMTTKELQEAQVKRLSAATQRNINGGLMNTGIASAMGNAAQGMLAGAQNGVLASTAAISTAGDEN